MDMFLLTVLSGFALDETVSFMKKLVEQFATLKFEGAFMYAVLLAAAVYICLEGYGIYRFALSAIGFAVGYRHSYEIMNFFNISTDTMDAEKILMIEVGAGLVVAVLTYTVVKAGIFIAAYHFAQANLSAFMVSLVAEKVEVPELLFPIFAKIVGVAAAVLVAWLLTKSERIVVIVVTAVVGGFAAVDFFRQMLSGLPMDLDFMNAVPEIVWVIAKCLLAAIGVGVQGTKKSAVAIIPDK